MSATYVDGLIGKLTPRETGPRADKALTTDTAKVVVFEFAAGQELSDHAARHPVIIAVLSGHATLRADGVDYDLRPGCLVHLTEMMRHEVLAHEDTTLTVTMLLPTPNLSASN